MMFCQSFPDLFPGRGRDTPILESNPRSPKTYASHVAIYPHSPAPAPATKSPHAGLGWAFADLNFCNGGFFLRVRNRAVSGLHSLQTFDPPPPSQTTSHRPRKTQNPRACAPHGLEPSGSTFCYQPAWAVRKTADCGASLSPCVAASRQGPAYRHLLASSRDSRKCSLTILVSSRSCARCPPCQALRDAVALPSGVRGPVLCFHGCHCRISSACRCLRSNVQGVAMLVLQ